ncbi:hypothetical protein T484DRAFT_1860718, partial [Baffinella frigidus]
VCSFDIEKQTSCPICDEALTMAEAVLRLSCKHVFHEVPPHHTADREGSLNNL